MELEITKKNFDELVLNSKLPVIIDFWAAWCGPCKMLGPVISEVAKEANGEYAVGKVNVDLEGELAQMFGVSSIPTVILFQGGKPVKKIIGYRPKKDILNLLK